MLGIPGSLLGGLFVELKLFGRKGALSLSTVLTGIFIFASTTAKSSNALLGWNCAYNFTSTFMYAVLYAYTPEIFPTKDRGTGNALTATANRIFGIMGAFFERSRFGRNADCSADHCDCCESADDRSCVYVWRAVRGCGFVRLGAALRVPR